MKIELCEVVKHYHLLEIDDALQENLMDIVSEASLHEDKMEELNKILTRFRDRFDYEYNIKENECGVDSVDLRVTDVVD